MLLEIPPWLSPLVALGGALMSAFAPSVLPEKFQAYAFYLGLALFCLGGIGIVAYIPWVQQFAEKGWPKLLTIVFGVAFIISAGWWGLSSYGGSRPASPSLIIRPVDYDAGIAFDDKKLMPTEEKSRPFSFSITNLSNSKITNANLQFEVVGVDVHKIIETTALFEDVKINKYKEAWVLTEVQQNGNSHSLIPLSNKGELIIDVISAEGRPATEFDLPKAVKLALSTFMIANSYRKFAAGENTPKMEAIKEWALAGGGLDRLREIQDDYLYDDWHEMPDLNIKIRYKNWGNELVRELVVVKSIYLFTLPAMWWPSETGRTLKAGAGILSYENPNQPDKGYYNSWKRRNKTSDRREVSSLEGGP